MKLLAIFSVSLLIMSAVNAAPAAKVLGFWQSSDEDSTTVLAHAEWQFILDTYLNTNTESGINLFDYETVSRADKKKLKAYLKSLQAIDPRRLNKAEQFAYWVNFYNALTIDVVLDKYPVESIKEIRFISSLFGPWDKNMIKVVGQKLSLNDIEHGILRPIWQDPRIHFAVNCASMGCPNLQAKAYTARNTEALLEDAAKAFINHARGVELTDKGVKLSSIFDWYSSDFGETQSEMLGYIAGYYLKNGRSGGAIDRLESAEKLEYQYNWQLNNAVK